VIYLLLFRDAWFLIRKNKTIWLLSLITMLEYSIGWRVYSE